MKTYTTLHAGLAENLEDDLVDILTRNESTSIQTRNLDVIWEGGHTTQGAYEEPLSEMCKRHKWQFSYEDYEDVVRIHRA